MNYTVTSKFFCHINFRNINYVMHFKNVAVARNFRVQTNHQTTRTVIVHNQIMNSRNRFMTQNFLFNSINKFLWRSRSQKRFNSVFCSFITSFKNKATYDNSANSINREFCKSGSNHRNNNYKCRNRIAQAVFCSSFHAYRIYFFRNSMIVNVHVKLNQNCKNHNDNCTRAGFQFHRMNKRINRRFYKFNSHKKNQKWNYKPGNIFKTTMTKRMSWIGLFSRKFESKNLNKRRCRIRQKHRINIPAAQIRI